MTRLLQFVSDARQAFMDNQHEESVPLWADVMFLGSIVVVAVVW